MICSTAPSPSTSASCQWPPRARAGLGPSTLSPHSLSSPSPSTTTTTRLGNLTLRLSSPHCPPLSLLPLPRRGRRASSLTALAFGKPKPETAGQQQEEEEEGEEVEEVEEELPWIQDKALDLVEFTGSITQWVPGPRVGVGQGSLPWLLLAIVVGYPAVTFFVALYRTVKKFNSPREKRRQRVNKNASLNKSIDQLFMEGRDEVNHSALQDLVKKTGFSMEDILRKYFRFALNERPFNGDMVVNLIQLRKASMLTVTQVAEILNEISRLTVKDKGPVVMDASGYSEKGFKRKLAVQALFGKILYLSELPEFCSRDSSLIVKEIFGVTDEDADQLRIHTLSDVGDIEAAEKMVESSSDSEDSTEG